MPRRRLVAMVVGIVLLGLGVFAARHTLHESLDVFAHLRWRWVPLAVLAEVVSISVFGLAQRHLVVAAGHSTPVGSAVRTAYAGNAISGSIPFIGSHLGTLFTFRAYRRHGVDGPTIAWALAIAGVLSGLAYGIVAGAGGVLSGSQLVTGAIAGSTVLLIASAVFGWFALRRESWRPGVTRRAVRAVTWYSRVAKQSLSHEPHEIVAVAFERFDALRPSKTDYATVFTYTLLNSMADVASLMLCILAVGAGVPWTRLILVWIAGNTAKGVPFTPGGVGFVEGAIALALVGSGLHPATATAAALLYRVMSYWMLIALGWIVVAIRTMRGGRRSDGENPEAGERTQLQTSAR